MLTLNQGCNYWGIEGVQLQPPSSSCLQTLVLRENRLQNFNLWAKFQTFRHLATHPPSSFRLIPTVAFPIQTNQQINRGENITSILIDSNKRRMCESHQESGRKRLTFTATALNDRRRRRKRTTRQVNRRPQGRQSGSRG